MATTLLSLSEVSDEQKAKMKSGTTLELRGSR